MTRYSKDERRGMRCGWIPDAQWSDEQRPQWGRLPGLDMQPEVCPGYSCCLPQVMEIAQCFRFESSSTGYVERYRSGGLTPTRQVSELLDIFQTQVNSSEMYVIDQRNKQR